MAEKRKRVVKKKKSVENPYYGHGAGKLTRMRKSGFTMAEIREMKK